MATNLRPFRTEGKTNTACRISRTATERTYLWLTDEPRVWPQHERRTMREAACPSHPSLAAYAAATVSAMRTDVIRATSRLPGGANPLIYKVRSGQRLIVEPLVGVALETVRRDPARADEWANFALHFLNLLSRARKEGR